jgi:hypothetical protein
LQPLFARSVASCHNRLGTRRFGAVKRRCRIA